MMQKFKLVPIDFEDNPNTFQINGKSVFAVRYECKFTKLYTSYASIKRSLEHCLFSIDFINHHRQKNEEPFVNENINAHYSLLLIHYGRCFASGNAKLEDGIIPKEFLEIHDKLIKLRNKSAAHLGGSGEGSIGLVALNPNLHDKKILYVNHPTFTRVNYINPAFLNGAKEVILTLLKYVNNKLEIFYNKINDGLRSLDIDELYKGLEKFSGLSSTTIPQGNVKVSTSIDDVGRVSINLQTL